MTTTTTDLGAALTRAHLAVARTYNVNTDGRDYSPSGVADQIAWELGYDRKRRDLGRLPATVAELYGTFEPNEEGATWNKNYRWSTALHVLAKAGADPADVDALREALGVEARDEHFADHVDDLNEQTRKSWMDRAIAAQAHAVAHAHEEGRREVLADLQKLAGSGLLDTRGSDLMGLSADIRRQTQVVDEHGATPLAAALATAKDGDVLTVAGVLTDVSWRTTKQGRHWASATLVNGLTVEVVLLPDVYARVCGLVAEGAQVEVSARYDNAQLVVQDLTAPEGLTNS